MHVLWRKPQSSFSSLLGSGPGQSGGFFGKPEGIYWCLGFFAGLGACWVFGFPVSQMIWVPVPCHSHRPTDTSNTNCCTVLVNRNMLSGIRVFGKFRKSVIWLIGHLENWPRPTDMYHFCFLHPLDISCDFPILPSWCVPLIGFSDVKPSLHF